MNNPLFNLIRLYFLTFTRSAMVLILLAGCGGHSQKPMEQCPGAGNVFGVNGKAIEVVSSHWHYYLDEACVAPYCEVDEELEGACDCFRVPGNSFDVHRVTLMLGDTIQPSQLVILLRLPHPDLFGHGLRPGTYELTKDWDAAVEDQRQEMEAALKKYGFGGIKKAPLSPLIHVRMFDRPLAGSLTVRDFVFNGCFSGDIQGMLENKDGDTIMVAGAFNVKEIDALTQRGLAVFERDNFRTEIERSP